MRPSKIVVHHSLTEDSGTVSWGAIRLYHTSNKGWSDIGYHAGVEKVKSGRYPYIEVLLGRPWHVPGAHTIGQNSESLGICFVGNYDLEAPLRDVLVAGGRLINMWMRIFDIPSSEIYRHSDFASYKSCPGSMFDMTRLREFIV
jgi:hypothetical protein